MKSELKDLVNQALLKVCGDGFTIPEFRIDRPNNPANGDFSTNVAFLLTKTLKSPPLKIAQEIVEFLEHTPKIQSVEAVKPGHINFKMNPESILEELSSITLAGNGFGKSSIGKGESILVEHTSCNPTGPVTVAHARGAIVGEVLSNLFAWTGHYVEREYYINDAGNQVNLLGLSVLLRCQEILGAEITLPDNCYQGEYIKEIAQAYIDEIHNDYMMLYCMEEQEDTIYDLKEQTKPSQQLLEFSVRYCLDQIFSSLDRIDVGFNNKISEKQLQQSDAFEALFSDLEQKGLTYTGKLAPPKGGDSESTEE